MKCAAALTVLLSLIAMTGTARAAETPTLEQRCTSDDASSYFKTAGRKTYVFDVENKCDTRLRCELAVAIFNSFGVTKGRRFLTIKPKSHGRLVLHLRTLGGMNSHEHHCRKI